MTQNVQSEYNEQEVYIRNGLRAATGAFHTSSYNAGWWMHPTMKIQMTDDIFMQCTKIALIHSEISEALEGLRKNKMDDHLPHRKSVEVELADALIRIFDLAGALRIDLGDAVIEKMRYNQVRPDHRMENREKADGKKV